MRSAALLVVALIAGILGTAPGVAHAGHDSTHANAEIVALVAEVADINRRLSELGDAIQVRQEAVNKAIVDVQSSRDAAAAAQIEVQASQRAIAEAPTAAAYQQALTDLRRSQVKASQAARAAQRSQDAAVAALTEAQKSFGAQQAEIDELAAAREAARSRLNAARDRWEPGTAPGTSPPANTGQWDMTLPMVPSANVADPAAIVNSVLQVSSTSMQVTADLGRKFLSSLGINLGGRSAVAPDAGITNGRIPRVYGRQASEYVIRRAMSQLGVPYSWGGGNASGPSRGIDQGANTVGFDCSGLMLYAFAGIGIKLPHYSGDQYNAGRKIPSSQMRRGDLIFYGPNASQHEAMYLGNGMMLEAPYTGSQVRVAPLRTAGMTPYVTRLIEY